MTLSASTIKTNQSTRHASLVWRVLFVGTCLLQALPLQAQTPASTSPTNWISAQGADSVRSQAADSASSLRPTGRFRPTGRVLEREADPADSLAADSTAAPSWWERVWARPRQWPRMLHHQSPQGRPFPGMSAGADRPVEDLADQLQNLVPGPLFDQGQVGHRQLLALDGLRYGAASLYLDGLDQASRITGLAELNLVAPGLCQAAAFDGWNRLGAHPGGQLGFSSRRAEGDSVLTRVAWADGFMGFITVDGDFQRPLLGGRLLAASRQLYTHERVPGAEYRGNLFQWNWDRPLGENWLLQVDQRLLHDRSDVLGSDGDRRAVDHHLLRARLGRNLGTSRHLELDAWRRRDRLGFDRALPQNDKEELHTLSLALDELWAGGGWHLQAAGEHQQLGSDSWELQRLESRLEASAAWTLMALGGRWVLEPAGSVRYISQDDLWGGNAGLRLGLSGLKSWGDVVVQVGILPPTAEQLHLNREPGLGDAVLSPWRRQVNLPLMADSTLGASHWQRQEMRLGTRLLAGRLALALRAWRVELVDDPLETPAGAVWSWKGWNHTQAGAQAFGTLQVNPRWKVEAAQAWFYDNRELLSREFPQWISDVVLGHERQLFQRELDLHLSLGLHHEYGGVNSLGQALWTAPELWLKGEGTRGAFSIWWALRNPFGLAENQRVEGRDLHGHEEWLGIRWTLQN